MQSNLRAVALHLVSILTGPEGPVQYETGRETKIKVMFQSSPAPKGRCNAGSRNACSAPTSFNPHRPRRAGAIRDAVPAKATVTVSILTGPEGPVQFGARRGPRQRHVSILTGPEGPVQSARLRLSAGMWLFQSSPAPKGRCNAGVDPRQPARPVSILTGPEGPVQS